MIGYWFLIARLCLAAVFLYSGVDKLWHWRSSIEEVKGDGLPWPAVFAGATVFTQLVGGCLVLRGRWRRWPSLRVWLPHHARFCSPASYEITRYGTCSWWWSGRCIHHTHTSRHRQAHSSGG